VLQLADVASAAMNVASAEMNVEVACAAICDEMNVA
jgi:hypothetical protein